MEGVAAGAGKSVLNTAADAAELGGEGGDGLELGNGFLTNYDVPGSAL